MAKKKSKTQKQKKNLKRKNNRLKTFNQYNTQDNNVKLDNKTTTKEKTSSEKRKIVSKDQVQYKLFTENKKENNFSNKILTTKNKIEVTLFKKNNQPQKKKVKVKKNDKLNLNTKRPNSYNSKNNIKKNQKKQKNIFLRLITELIKNSHIIFNTIIIIVFLLLILGLKRVEVFDTSFIVYIVGILLFLIIVAISNNKYISGKIFTIILCIIMSLGIYYLQYTYDFIRNLNSNVYEYREYYVVSFDNSSNKNIYNINNKKVGMLEENSVNVQRVLNTKLDKIKYITFKSQTDLIEGFYNNEYRAIIVTENQYKYLKNNKIEPNTDVKILYTFQVNAKKSS